jgi:hypothetical protein
MYLERKKAPEQIINYLRENNLFNSSNLGITINDLKSKCGLKSGIYYIQFQRLITAGIVIIKGLKLNKKGRPSKIIALNDDYRFGDNWKKVLAEVPYPYSKFKSKANITTPKAKLNHNHNIETEKEILLLIKLIKQLKESQSELIEIKTKLSAVLKENKDLKEKIAKLEEELKAADNTSRESQLEITRLSNEIHKMYTKLRAQEIRDYRLNREIER